MVRAMQNDRAPLLDELADEYDGKVKIGKVNIDEQQELATKYGIRAIPTLLLINKGQVAEADGRCKKQTRPQGQPRPRRGLSPAEGVMSLFVTPGQINRRAQLYEQLAAMITAGVPLIRALELASRNNSLRGSRKSILELISHLQEGFTFTDSMKKIQGWMPEFDAALLSVGEQSGRLDVSFKLLGRYHASRAKIIRDTISGLLVTIMTLNVFLVVFSTGLSHKFRDGNH